MQDVLGDLKPKRAQPPTFQEKRGMMVKVVGERERNQGL